MKKVALMPNITKDLEYQYTKRVIELIGSRATILMDTSHSFLGGPVQYVSTHDLYAQSDIVIALGGDGTILSVAGGVSKYNVPVLGINLGHLGFLAEVEPYAIASSLDKLFAGSYTIDERIMLHAVVERGGQQVQSFHALNDVVVSRASFSRLLSLTTLIDGTVLDSFVSDGVILSTPTGSTAYSLSAGGPILDPSLDVMLVTPICPHTMHSRSMVLPLCKKVSVRLDTHGENGSFVTADGKQGVTLREGDLVNVTKSSHTTKLIRITGSSFYDTVRRKLSERGIPSRH